MKIIINAEVEKWDTFSLCSKHRLWMLRVQEIIPLLYGIYCVVQNYAKHVREMGANPEREARFFQQTRRCSLH